MIDVHAKLLESGYVPAGRNEAGTRYKSDHFTVYRSGYMLVFIRDGGMSRAFSEDRLLFFSIEDMERQVGIRLSGWRDKEDRTNYDFPKRER